MRITKEARLKNQKKIEKQIALYYIKNMINRSSIIKSNFHVCSICKDEIINEAILKLKKWEQREYTYTFFGLRKTERYICIKCLKEKIEKVHRFICNFLPTVLIRLGYEFYIGYIFENYFDDEEAISFLIDCLNLKFPKLRLQNIISQDDQWKKDYEQALKEL